MSSNNISPLPKEYDTPSEKVRKTSGYLDDTKQALVTTTDKVFKEGNTAMVDKEGKLKKCCGGSHHSSYFKKKENLHSQQNREITSLQ